MKYNIYSFTTLLSLLLLSVSCGSGKMAIPQLKPSADNVTLTSTFTDIAFKTGAENFECYLPMLKDKRVGIVTNQTGILSKEKHLVDFLLEQNVNLQKIYAPEHGFRGTADAGELIVDGKDTKTNLPIISLYGNNKKPKSEQLEGIDILVFDLQDVGARFYTYISSLHYVMAACAENKIPLLVLDRPNPNGTIIDGPILEKEHKSFVVMHEITD